MAKKNIPGDVPPVENDVTINPDITENIDSAIVTQEELKKEKEKKEPKKKKEEKETKKATGTVQFELPYAPMGNAKTVIQYKFGSEKVKKELKLYNKLYKFPDGLNKKESAVLRQALLDNGFVDISKFDVGTVYNEKEKKYTYSAIHPEHTTRNPMNGNISLAMIDEDGSKMYDKDGKQICKQVSMINGTIKTDDKAIYQALLRAGFRSGYKTVKED